MAAKKAPAADSLVRVLFGFGVAIVLFASNILVVEMGMV